MLALFEFGMLNRGVLTSGSALVDGFGGKSGVAADLSGPLNVGDLIVGSVIVLEAFRWRAGFTNELARLTESFCIENGF